MIFCGDIALPYTGASKYGIPEELKTKVWMGNLEGSVIRDSTPHGVYNAIEAVEMLSRELPFKVYGIANNHQLDAGSLDATRSNMKDVGVPVVGGGTLSQASQSVVVNDTDETLYRILAFGWENIQCKPATNKRAGVNPYTRSYVMKCVAEELRRAKHEKLICYMHCNYELEKYPQPYDRQLAMDLIDMGVSAVIECHAHRVQPIEMYKGRPIVYGLGNFLFCQGHYMGGALRFPKFCEEEYAFEIADGGNKFVVHHFHYDSCRNSLEFVQSEEASADKDFDGKAVFTGFSAKDYELWFKAHRVQKKILPVFKAHESNVSYFVKSTWIKIRGEMINLLTSVNLKSANRADRQ